jgi:hypothetical protein
MSVLEESFVDLRGKLDTVASAHQVERAKLEERYSAAEARWAHGGGPSAAARERS